MFIPTLQGMRSVGHTDRGKRKLASLGTEESVPVVEGNHFSLLDL